jgi:hypothetical protein
MPCPGVAHRLGEGPRQERVRGRAPCHARGPSRSRGPSYSFHHASEGSRRLGCGSESEGEAAETPQLRTVEATCEAKWPAHMRPTEAKWATLRGPPAVSLEGEPAAVAAAGAHAHARTRGGAGASGRRVLSVDADAKRVKFESYSVRVGHGLEARRKRRAVSRAACCRACLRGRSLGGAICRQEGPRIDGGGGAATAHGRGHVRGQLARTKATDRNRVGHPEGAATRGLEGEPPWEEVIASPRGTWARIEGASLRGHGLGPEDEGEVAEGLQLRTVEAMYEANWPAQRRSTEAEWATLGAPLPVVLRGRLLGRRQSRHQGGLGPENRGRARLRGHSLGPEGKGEGEVAEGPQPRTVEAMCDQLVRTR